MASFTFGVTASTMVEEALSSLQSVDQSSLDAAIDSAAGDVCVMLRAQRITPSSVTQVAYPDDFQWLHDTVTYGAAFIYLRNTSGSVAAASPFEGQYASRMNRLQTTPNMLESYNSNLGGANTVISQMSKLSNEEIEARRARLERPERRVSWETL
jgi:hypothetical protein